MTFLPAILAAIAVLPADRLAMADRLFNRGEYAAAKAEYAELSKDKSLSKAELVYRGGRTEETLLPYYRFYVLLPEELQPDAAAEDLAVYGAYYVPAIAGEYITNMPLYDGSFN